MNLKCCRPNCQKFPNSKVCTSTTKVGIELPGTRELKRPPTRLPMKTTCAESLNQCLYSFHIILWSWIWCSVKFLMRKHYLMLNKTRIILISRWKYIEDLGAYRGVRDRHKIPTPVTSLSAGKLSAGSVSASLRIKEPENPSKDARAR